MINGYSLADVVAAAKAETLRARCEASAILAIAAGRDPREAVDGLRRHAADSGLAEWLGADEIEKIIARAFETARRELAKATE